MTLTKKDFVSDQQVRWCPGCGDYAILNTVQNVFAKLDIPKENFAIISGIGCAARFPYYMNTYGFHTIHGRAPAIATGLQVARPDLSVWVVGGDGDMLSIGGNHLLHALRRNVNIKILCFNNRIYGLTKGQASPTSEVGKVTGSTPMGLIDRPVNPISIALAAEASFVARSLDTYGAHLSEVLMQAAQHEGSVFVEIMQNCNIFNNGTWDDIRVKDSRMENALQLTNGEPMRFGKDGEKGIVLKDMRPHVVTLGEAGISEKDLMVYDETNGPLAYMISRMGFPTPIGVFKRVELPTYAAAVDEQIARACSKEGAGDLMNLLHSGDVWEVE
ncbi:MAG: 2-oxoacid:ferredoxin oxidoreductase subunit beta [Planctomycetota bacterium]|jgi:2-oxoglutarate ferredoxin oxidoreductase subunit beta